MENNWSTFQKKLRSGKRLLPSVVIPGRGGVNQKACAPSGRYGFLYLNALLKASFFNGPLNTKARMLSHPGFLIAEEKGFEPLVPARVQRFSRPPHSTALPFLP